MSRPACCAASGVSLDVVGIPSTQRSEAQLLSACVCPNHSSSSIGLRHQQQQQCSFASVAASPGTAAGKPCSCCCGGHDVSHTACCSSTVNTVDITLYGNLIQFLLIILKLKFLFISGELGQKGWHRVRVFNAMLVLIFIPQ